MCVGDRFLGERRFCGSHLTLPRLLFVGVAAQMGAIGVARCLAYTGRKGHAFYDPAFEENPRAFENKWCVCVSPVGGLVEWFVSLRLSVPTMVLLLQCGNPRRQDGGRCPLCQCGAKTEHVGALFRETLQVRATSPFFLFPGLHPNLL